MPDLPPCPDRQEYRDSDIFYCHLKGKQVSEEICAGCGEGKETADNEQERAQ